MHVIAWNYALGQKSPDPSGQSLHNVPSDLLFDPDTRVTVYFSHTSHTIAP